MAKNNPVECFMYYICNEWGLEEAHRLFGKQLGDHIFGKWLDIRSQYDTTDFYGALDKECRDKIYERAIELYSNN